VEKFKGLKDLLKTLISIKSVSGFEQSIQDFIEKWLRKQCLYPIKQYVEGKRYNLFLRGESPYLISCHVDTVPPLGMKDPYLPKEVGNRIYGRGSADVKGSIAALLKAIEIFKNKYPHKNLPFSLAFVVDEENNSALGSEKIIELLKKEKFCLVLEPTYGMLCTSQMGSLEFSLTVEGPSAHASEFEKVKNPIKVLIGLVNKLEKLFNRQVNFIMIKGGSLHYIVPKKCFALLEIKIKKGESWKEMETLIREIVKDFDKECKITFRAEDGEDFISFSDEDFISFLEETHFEALGRKPVRGTMPSWTDAANYHKAGLSCAIFGYGSLKDSHTERENISLEDLECMTSFLLALFEKLR